MESIPSRMTFGGGADDDDTIFDSSSSSPCDDDFFSARLHPSFALLFEETVSFWRNGAA